MREEKANVWASCAYLYYLVDISMNPALRFDIAPNMIARGLSEERRGTVTNPTLTASSRFTEQNKCPQ